MRLAGSAVLASCALSVTLLSPRAHADGVPPPPYSLPWQLRPAAPTSVVRSDSVIASFENPATGDRGTTFVSTLLASYKVTPYLSPLVRFAWAHTSPPIGDSGEAFVNPMVGLTVGVPIAPEWKLAFFAALTIPIGQGGGNHPDPGALLARTSAVPARSGMDNALFAVNDLTPIGGIDLAWVKYGFTVQAEATVLQLMRARGADAQPESAKTNFTSGLHVGYFLLPPLSIGAELRYQRWFTTPTVVVKDSSARDTMTFAVGLRAHVPLGSGMWLRPGISYATPIDDPMAAAEYHIVQFDVPFAF